MGQQAIMIITDSFANEVNKIEISLEKLVQEKKDFGKQLDDAKRTNEFYREKFKLKYYDVMSLEFAETNIKKIKSLNSTLNVLNILDDKWENQLMEKIVLYLRENEPKYAKIEQLIMKNMKEVYRVVTDNVYDDLKKTNFDDDRKMRLFRTRTIRRLSYVERARKEVKKYFKNKQ